MPTLPETLDDLPKPGTPNLQFPEKADVLEILKQAPAESRLFFLLDAMTGLRRGELLALQWKDIDWLQSEVIIERSISKQKATDGVHKYQWAVGPTKTGQVRTVGIPSTVLAALQALRTTSEHQQEEDFIFTRNGMFISPQHFTKKISSPLLKAATQGRVGGLHRLRHFFASMLIAQGESPKYVQDQLGHKSIKTTFDIYGHVMSKAKKEATAKLELSIFGGQPEPDVRTLLEPPSSDENEQTIN